MYSNARIAALRGLLDCVHVLYQFTLEAPQSADGHVYALSKKLTPSRNMQLNVLNDLAEAMMSCSGGSCVLGRSVGMSMQGRTRQPSKK